MCFDWVLESKRNCKIRRRTADDLDWIPENERRPKRPKPKAEDGENEEEEKPKAVKFWENYDVAREEAKLEYLALREELKAVFKLQFDVKLPLNRKLAAKISVKETKRLEDVYVRTRYGD
jgi:hypothetical protein